MDEAENKANSENPNLNINESEKKTEISNIEAGEVSAVNKGNRSESSEKPINTVSLETDAVQLEETKGKTIMDDDDGEDLPDNFFDDFSNNDFMAGLDIVDDWMDDEEDPEKRPQQDDYFQDDAELRTKSSEKKYDFKRDHRREVSPRHKRKYSDRGNYMKRTSRYPREDEKFHRYRDRSLERRSRDRELDRRRSRERELERRRSKSRDRFRDERRSRERFRSRDRSKPREHDKHSPVVRSNSKDVPLDENIDSRRDPEKTKRDIQRDKVRCAKDFEARVLQEQLKVAETGLVPPGMELDVVMEHEKRKQEQQTVIEKSPERKQEESPQQPLENKRSVDRYKAGDKTHSDSRGRFNPDQYTRERHSRERHSRDRHSRDRHSRDRHSRERHSRERHSHDRQSRERHSRERRSRERRSRDRRSRERHSRERHSPERGSRNRRYSPDLRSRKREYNRFNRSKDRSTSPRHHRRSRSLDKEEMYRRNDDLRLRIREKRRERLFNELSPVSEVKFSRSPSLTNLSLISNISEREFWLRNRDKHKSRYGRSCSPISSSSLSDVGSPRRKRSRKTSFMEEIEQKLRERKANTTQYGSPIVAHSTPPQPVPQPVPPPQHFTQQMPFGIAFQPQKPQMFPPQKPQMFPHQKPQMFPMGMVPRPFPQPQVDHGMMMLQQQHQLQSMPMMNMMGAPTPMGVMPVVRPSLQPMQMPMPMQSVNPVPMQTQQSSTLNSGNKTDSSSHRTASNLKPCVSDTNKEVTKLFEEQKISLSDYLSVSAKPIDPKLPINVHKKIKVIAKCQDVIRILKEDSKFCGRFYPKPVPPGMEKPEEKAMKWKSPLRKTFPVRFMFTTPCRKPPSQKDFVKNIINKLLFVCGIPAIPQNSPLPSADTKTTNASTSAKPSTNISTPQVVSTPKPVPAPVSFSVAQQKPKYTPLPQQSVLIKRATIGLQTDPVKCQICEIRSARKFSDQACQTIETEVESISTQVTNEDLQKSMVTFTPRGILKNSGSSLQSLSHLTPAQLLSLQKETTDDGWNIATRNDTFSGSRNLKDQYSVSSGNFMTRNSLNTSSMNTSYNSQLNMNMSSRLNNTNIPGNNFNSSYSGGVNNPPFSNMQNRSFSGQMSNQPSSMNPGNSMSNFQMMASRITDTFSRDANVNMGNSGNPMNSNMSNRGRGATGNRGFFMGNYGGQNRPF